VLSLIGYTHIAYHHRCLASAIGYARFPDTIPALAQLSANDQAIGYGASGSCRTAIFTARQNLAFPDRVRQEPRTLCRHVLCLFPTPWLCEFLIYSLTSYGLSPSLGSHSGTAGQPAFFLSFSRLLDALSTRFVRRLSASSLVGLSQRVGFGTLFAVVRRSWS
jgi:hypothetical protein